MVKLIKEDGTAFEIERDILNELRAAEPDDFELDDDEVVPDMGGLRAPESTTRERASFSNVEKKPRSEAADQAVIKEQLARISEFIDAGNKFKGLIANEARKLIDAWNRVDSTDYFGDQRQLKEAVRQATETIEAQIAKLGNVSPEVLDIFEEGADMGGLKEPEAKIDDEVVMENSAVKKPKKVEAVDEATFFAGQPSLGEVKKNPVKEAMDKITAHERDLKNQLAGLLEQLNAKFNIKMKPDGSLGFFSSPLLNPSLRRYNKLVNQNNQEFHAILDQITKLQTDISNVHAVEGGGVGAPKATLDARSSKYDDIANTGFASGGLGIREKK